MKIEFSKNVIILFVGCIAVILFLLYLSVVANTKEEIRKEVTLNNIFLINSIKEVKDNFKETRIKERVTLRIPTIETIEKIIYSISTEDERQLLSSISNSFNPDLINSEILDLVVDLFIDKNANMQGSFEINFSEELIDSLSFFIRSDEILDILKNPITVKFVAVDGKGLWFQIPEFLRENIEQLYQITFSEVVVDDSIWFYNENIHNEFSKLKYYDFSLKDLWVNDDILTKPFSELIDNDILIDLEKNNLLKYNHLNGSISTDYADVIVSVLNIIIKNIADTEANVHFSEIFEYAYKALENVELPIVLYFDELNRITNVETSIYVYSENIGQSVKQIEYIPQADILPLN